MVTLVRALLQQSGASQDVEACRQLGGVSVGGWIVLGLLIGFCCGVVSTVLFQWYRRRREEKYLLQLPPASDEQTLDFSKQPLASDVETAAATTYRLPAVHASAAAMPAAPGPRPQKYFSPLTKSMSAGPGGILAMSEGMRSNIRLSEAGGGDTINKSRSDQQSPVDVHGHALSAAQGPHSTSYIAPSQQASRLAAITHRVQPHAAQQSRPFDPAAYGPRVHVPRPNPASSPDSSDPDYNSSYQKLPISITHSSMPECLPSPTPEASRNLPAMPAAMPVSTDAGTAPGLAPGGQGPSVGAAAQHPQRQGTMAAAAVSNMHAESSTVDVDDAYEEHELDDDWKKLLGDVDGRLLAQNQPAMDARERSVAIKKLLIATGTRGVDFAMNAALQEVMQFRRFHGH